MPQKDREHLANLQNKAFIYINEAFVYINGTFIFINRGFVYKS